MELRAVLGAILFAVCLPFEVAYAQQAESVELPWDHPEMKAAVAKARRSLPTFWRKLEDPSPGEINFSLQVKLTDGLDTEHLWVLMIEREEERISGIVASQPQQLATIKYGERVSFSEEQITDWSYSDQGRLIGYETIRPQMKRMPPKQAHAWERLFAGTRE